MSKIMINSIGLHPIDRESGLWVHGTQKMKQVPRKGGVHFSMAAAIASDKNLYFGKFLSFKIMCIEGEA